MEQSLDQEQWEESIHATAIRYLLDNEQKVVAALLLDVDPKLWQGLQFYEGSRRLQGWYLYLHVPHPLLNKFDYIIKSLILESYAEALGADNYLMDDSPIVELRREEVDSDWRESYWRQLEGKDISNQAKIIAAPPYSYKRMGFRSKTEMLICKAFEKTKALFFPLPLANSKGIIKEPDFLVCHEGKWGILEVAGKPYHPPSRAAEDHERTRWFEHHGIRVHIYDANKCYQDPEGVVKEFLSLLKRG